MYMKQVRHEVTCIITLVLKLIWYWGNRAVFSHRLHQVLQSCLATEQALTDYYDRIGLAPSSTVSNQDGRH